MNNQQHFKVGDYVTVNKRGLENYFFKVVGIPYGNRLELSFGNGPHRYGQEDVKYCQRYENK